MQRHDTQAKENLQKKINPIVQARINRGYTQDDLAAVANRSKIFIQNLEFGIAGNNIPVRVLEELSDSSKSGTKNLQNRYTQWIADTRLTNAEYLIAPVAKFCDYTENELFGDWLALRNAISTSKIGFCKLYCLHPQILATFENSWKSRTEFTPGMRELFRDCNFGVDTLRKMDNALLRGW